MNLKNGIIVFFSALFGASFAIGVNQYLDSKKPITSNYDKTIPIQKVNYISNSSFTNFTYASSISTPAVVHVNTSYTKSTQNSQEFYGNNMFEYFFGNPKKIQPKSSKASGSGVIISEDGFILTNNHVIENADDIQVNLSNNQNYKATLIGTDKDTDLALIKIEEKGLPYLNFANSDSVLVGQWVLAVGNPFNLASTVTAGIVSAKARNINLLQNIQGQSNTAIESFIQTDAAINPGNSGGALVNTDGDLIGINTAIATPNGSYAGYAFAVPSNIASKVAFDLMEFGTVQRAYLGVNILSVDNSIAQHLDLKETKGVYLQNILKDGAADEAGLQNEDVIITIEGEEISNIAELQEKLSSYSPGNVIEVSFLRKNKLLHATLSLKNRFNNKEILTNTFDLSKQLGIKVRELTKNEKVLFKQNNGIVVEYINSDGLVALQTKMRENFVITKVDNLEVNNKSDFAEIIGPRNGTIMIEGNYIKDNSTYLYAIDIE